MAPDGVIAMSVWSNIAECARFMFRRLDPGFHDRALSWGGGLIVGGHNYGQGSSREHAALAPLHLGVPAIVARSYARIHRRNLIAQGIVPLTFAEEGDYDRVEQGDEWTIRGLRSGPVEAPVPLDLRLTARERDILVAGGLIAFARSSR